eukprot:TRINITY_DN9062_c0_g1_i1.p1 TRINITY_DN9062_c0_g1~~TRINITY_DN9062_c0_g1_i1.p1  ORF type:complete len:243 (+),score=37.49 TRINITY_DN9062_c0_g1_i1:116-844(+)
MELDAGGLTGVTAHVLVRVALFSGLTLNSDGQCPDTAREYAIRLNTARNDQLEFDFEQCFAKLTPVCTRFRQILMSSDAWGVLPVDLTVVLHDLVLSRQSHLVKMLLEAIPDPDCLRFGSTALLTASFQGDTPTMQHLLLARANPGFRNEGYGYSTSPLQMAVSAKQGAAVQLLLEAGVCAAVDREPLAAETLFECAHGKAAISDFSQLEGQTLVPLKMADPVVEIFGGGAWTDQILSLIHI